MSLTTAFRRSMPSLLQATYVPLQPPLLFPASASERPTRPPNYVANPFPHLYSRSSALPASTHNHGKTHASPNDKGTHSEEAVHAEKQHNPKVEEAVANKDNHNGQKTKEEHSKK